MRASKIIFWILCATLLLPVAQLLFGWFGAADQESWQHITRYLIPSAVRDSLILTTAVCLLSLAFGLPAAWCVTRYRFPGRRLLSILLVLPLAVPPYVAAYISTDAREALIPWLVEIRRTQGPETYQLVEIVHRYAWLSAMLAAVLYPYVFLAARAAFAANGHRLAEAARSLGAGPWQRFFRVSLPMARPALVAGLFLVAMESLNDYGAASHFGIQTLTPTLFRTWFGLGDLSSALRLASLLLLTILLARLLEVRLRGRAKYDQRHRPSDPHITPKPGRRILCYAACLIPISIGFLYPCLTLFHWLKLTGGPEQLDAFLRATTHALTLGLIVTTACLVLALPLNAINRFSPNRLRDGVLRSLSITGYAAPGAVLAIAIFATAGTLRSIPNLPPVISNLLISGSILWLAYGLIVRYFAIAGQMVRESYDAIPQRLDESARLLGQAPARNFFGVHLPLLRPALAGAGVIIFIDVVKELPLTLILRPFDFETLGTWAYSLANQGRILDCAAPSLAMIAIGSLGLVVVELLIWKRL
ncbi:MAG: iron ABC transporter permease [Verrucomicrobiota bacterium]